MCCPYGSVGYGCTFLVPRLCQTNDAMRTERNSLALSSVGCLSQGLVGVVMIAVFARSRIRTRPGRDGSKHSSTPEQSSEVATDRLCNWIYSQFSERSRR
jgi:hypothetical protein